MARPVQILCLHNSRTATAARTRANFGSQRPVTIDKLSFQSSIIRARAAASVHSNAALHHETASRPLANFPADIWGDYFTTITVDQSRFEAECVETEVMKEEVKKMFLGCKSIVTPIMEKIELIDATCRLGVAYHFKNEIEDELKDILTSKLHLLIGQTHAHGLYSTSLAFRVLRRHGYKLSSDVFDKFMDSDGLKFKESLASDPRGLLSLYEASFLSIPGEEILDQAFEFSKAHLESLVSKDSVFRSTNLGRQVIGALKCPFHKGVERLETRQYIDLYETRENRENEILLKLAKLDYNRLQFLYQQKLRALTEWGKEIKIAEKLTFGRYRTVESYVFTLIMHSEPQYSAARILQSKANVLFAYVDDMYDAYATYEEKLCFIKAIQRWDYDCLENLPTDPLKALYKIVLDTFSELDHLLSQEGRSFDHNYVKQAIKDASLGFQRESEWLRPGSEWPSVDDYLYISTICGFPMVAASFMAMEGIAGNRDLVWLLSYPRLFSTTMRSGRILDDIASHKVYMREFGVCEEKAIEELKKMIPSIWKEVNEDSMKLSPHLPRDLINLLVNNARLFHYFYGTDIDLYTHPENMEEDARKMFIDRLP